MTVNRGLWVPINTGNVGTTDLEARLADAALFESNDGINPRSGVLNPASTVLVTGTANMTYDVKNIYPVINRASNEGAYRFSLTGTTNVATTAAPGANSRIDIIYVKQNDQAKGDANNLAIVGVAQGAAAASPLAPAIPTGAIEIARATVPALITGTTGAAITQTFKYAALKGTPIPVRNTTERAEITAPRVGQQVKRLDLTGNMIEEWNGTAWVGEDFSPVNTGDANWTYRGGLWRDSRFGVPVVQMRLRLIRTGGSFALTTSALQAFTALIPTGWRPVGYSASTPTILNTSTAAEKWGLIARVADNGDFSLRTDGGSTTVNTGDVLYINLEWVQ